MIWEDESKRPKGNFSFNELRTSIVTKALQNLNIENEEIVNYLVNQYSKRKHEVIYVFEDVEMTLKKLKKRGYLIALLTNGDRLFKEKSCNVLIWKNYLMGIFIDGEQGVGKPKKEPILMC